MRVRYIAVKGMYISGCIKYKAADSVRTPACGSICLIPIPEHESGAGPPQKVGERVTRVTPLAKGPVEALLSSLNLGPQQGLDPEPENIVAVGTFTSTPPGQPPQQVTLIQHQTNHYLPRKAGSYI